MKIISNHIPKVGGLTFRGHLEYIYGNKNIIHDYTLCGHPDYRLTPPPPYILKRLRHAKKTTIIHGHFLMERYANIPGVHYICWVRNPVERLLSHYYYWLRAPDYNHPYCLKLVNDGLSVVDFAKLLSNLFTKRLTPIEINDFVYIGVVEHFNDSLKLFYNMFCPDIKPKTDIYENRNFARDTTEYRINEKQRREIEKINSQDMEFYKKAIERFEYLKDRYQHGF